MFEQTNEADLENDGADLFAAEQASETEEAQEISEAQAAGEMVTGENIEGLESSAKTAEEADKEPTIRVKINGEEKDIPLAEAANLAEKGMDYDKLAKEHDALKNSEEIRVLDAWAQQNGMTRAEFIKVLAAQREEALIQSVLEEVQGEYPQIPEEAALEIAKKRAGEKRMQNEENANRTQAALEAEKLKPWQEFIERYPFIKDVKDLPERVITDMAGGTPPIEAMQRHELKELKKQFAELEKKQAAEVKNSDNRRTSTGSAASKGAQTSPDAFFAGFDS